jgi:hypothetical protein
MLGLRFIGTHACGLTITQGWQFSGNGMAWVTYIEAFVYLIVDLLIACLHGRVPSFRLYYLSLTSNSLALSNANSDLATLCRCNGWLGLVQEGIDNRSNRLDDDH